MKEFIAALEGANITTKLENGKIHLRREVKRPWPFKPETINYSIGFAGWSRSVGAKTAREVLQKLKLYEEYPDYQDFLEGKEPMYQMVEQFEVPLRRLKDEWIRILCIKSSKSHLIDCRTSFPLLFRPFCAFPRVGQGVGQSWPAPWPTNQIRRKVKKKSCFLSKTGLFWAAGRIRTADLILTKKPWMLLCCARSCQ